MSDVIIIGGGPAGAGLGCYLSKEGISNTIIEKTIHPRDHVGESLVTNVVRIFQDLDFVDTMEKARFIHKDGASWHPPQSRGKFSIHFPDFPVEDIKQPYTYHVDRSQFDLLLLKHAEKLGSTVYQGMPVTQVLFENGQANGVRVKLGNQQVDLHCKLVVDASGRDTLLGRQLRLKEKDPLFNQFAVHAWFENVDRGTGSTADHIHIFFLPIEKGWVWQIPVTDKLTSVGVVTEKSDFTKAGMDVADFFFTHVQSNPDLAHAMRNACQVRDFKLEGDYSYSMSRFVGDGYMMVGDAARFVDPIFSSGISVALHSAKFASQQIVEAMAANDFGETSLLPYEQKLRRGVEIWYEFIRLYYKLLPLFTHFIQKPEYKLQLHRLLQGEVFDRDEAPVLKAMRDYIAAVEKSDSHILREHLLDIPIT